MNHYNHLKRAPLFQRSTFQMNVKKMYFSDALEFLDGVSAEVKINYLSIFGEHPFYLEMIDKTKMFVDNLRRLLFSRFGNLVDAPDKILPSASNDQNMYNTILKAIAHRMDDKESLKTLKEKVENLIVTSHKIDKIQKLQLNYFVSNLDTFIEKLS